MTCVDCHGAIPTPTSDPFRCPVCRVGARRVTDFSEVTLELEVATYWALPARVRDLLQIYGREVPAPRGWVAVRVATYRLEEIEAAARVLGEPR